MRAISFRSSTIRNYFIRCTVLNGFIFLGSIYFYHALLIPLIRYTFREQFSSPGQASSSGLASLVEWLSGTVYYLFWVYPIYSISFVLSSRWFQTIAKRANYMVVGTRSATQSKLKKRTSYQRYIIMKIRRDSIFEC
jgi:etoposide-induced 2.4 mRNA